MNINKTIWEFAKCMGLDWIATGGGCDYVWKGTGMGTAENSRDGERVSFVLGSTEDLASTPDALNEPSTVGIYINDPEWLNGTFINFPTATQAMEFMASASNAWTIDNPPFPEN